MTTITFQEKLDIKGNPTSMSVADFLEILEENGYFPLIKEASSTDTSDEIKSKFLKSKTSKTRINI